MEGVKRKLYPVLQKFVKHMRCLSTVSSIPKLPSLVWSSNTPSHRCSSKLLLPRYKHSFYSYCKTYSDSSNNSSGRNDGFQEDLLEKDEELRGILSDIKSDFNDSLPTKPPKGKKQQVQDDKHHEPVDSKPCELCSNTDKDIPNSVDGQFKLYDDTQVEEIMDFDEEQNQKPTYLYQEKEDVHQKYQFKRGCEGVFDMEELVTVLQQENGMDIAVISVPKHLHYSTYLVLVTAKSPRHLKAMAEFINKMYKKKKSISDPFLNLEGKFSQDWKIFDMGHIVLHMFLEPTRSTYDLETLWTVGEDYDDLSHLKQDPVLDLLQQHIQFLDEIETLPTAERQ